MPRRGALGLRRARRGDAAPGSGRHAHPHRPHVRRLGGRRRVQRRPRPAPLFRLARRRRHGARRQRRRAARRDADASRRRGHQPCLLAALRRLRQRVACRPQLHRTGFRIAPGPHRVRPRTHRGGGDAARRRRLATVVRRRGRALAAHGRDLRRPVPVHGGRPARGAPRGEGGGDRRLLRPQLPRRAVGQPGRPGSRRRSQPRRRPLCRRDARQRGGLQRRPRILGRPVSTRTCPNSTRRTSRR